MATYTTNYNLYMPEPTDPVGDFRAEFNSNMQTIDQNLGGGGGGSSTLAGLTDVSLSSPTNGQVLSYNSTSQKWENANGGGGGGDTYNVYGAFIDTANVIVSRTSYHGNDSYTATEDCFVSYEVACPANDNAYVEIDGVAVCKFYFPMICFASDNIPLKAGQTISFSNAYSGYSSYYTVYGITQGVNQVGHHYSTNEQVIGTWIDGKPIYQRTWTGTKNNGQDEAVISDLLNVDVLVDSRVTFIGNTGSQIVQYYRDANDRARIWIDGGDLKVHMDSGNNYPVLPITWYITLQYTKTTD